MKNNAAYSYEDITGLYIDRWIIETFYNNLKHIVKVEKFHSKSEAGALQEIYAAMILTVILRKFMRQAAKKYDVVFEDINFK